MPLGEETEVIKRASQKVGSSWKKLARELELKVARLDFFRAIPPKFEP